MYQILGVGSISFPDEFTVSYQTYSPCVIEKLIDYCIEIDPSDDLALRYKCLLRARRHFKNLDDLERMVMSMTEWGRAALSVPIGNDNLTEHEIIEDRPILNTKRSDQCTIA